jgi:hypothetical protein
MSVFDTVGLVCSSSEPGSFVCLILGIVSIEPYHLAVTLKGKYMGGDAI